MPWHAYESQHPVHAPLDGHPEPVPMTHPIPLFERLELAVDLARATAVATSASQCPDERPAAAASAAASAAVAMASPLWRAKAQKRPYTVSGDRRRSPEPLAAHRGLAPGVFAWCRFWF